MKILSILMVGFVLMSCSREGDKEETTDIQPPEGMEVKVEGGMNIPVLAELDTVNPPVLTFKEPEYKFGTIDEGDVVNHEFVFENTGNSPLIIVDAQSSCGCTIPSVSQEPVMPGKTGSIKVKFNSKDKSGKITKAIRISANTYPNPITVVTLKGNVED